MTDIKTYSPSKELSQNAHITPEKYDAMYNGSINQPDIFWAVQSKRIDWFKQPTIIKNTNFEGDVSIKWYEDGVLNACWNCLDRHLEENGEKIAF
ncbi:MAG: acetyl-coenzyme A synthetase N-terminal domain-containing protein, partial [Bdellovibrionales bacterium]